MDENYCDYQVNYEIDINSYPTITRPCQFNYLMDQTDSIFGRVDCKQILNNNHYLLAIVAHADDFMCKQEVDSQILGLFFILTLFLVDTYYRKCHHI